MTTEARGRYLRGLAIQRLTGVPTVLRDAAVGRVWFWKPQISAHSWRSWSPAWIGHDEYSRRTLVLGFPWTGRAIIALWFCGDVECYSESVEMIRGEHD